MLSKHLGTLYRHLLPRLHLGRHTTQIPQPVAVVVLLAVVSTLPLSLPLTQRMHSISRQPRQRAEYDMQLLHQQRKAALICDPSCTGGSDT